ncbi:helix-turn-helix domain-containing protein, partial [Bacillus tropicus]|uniref:PucR family transcriptional regulator n=1 Tax=Bacillus tropicus TaxID=2026188 RepID=UPI002DBA7E19
FLTLTIDNLRSSPELMHTLRLFIYYNQSYKQTAQQLHRHINTVHYRLKNIEEYTGLDPKQFKDLNILYFSLLLLDNQTKKNDIND